VRTPLGRRENISREREIIKKKTRKMKTLQFSTPCFAAVLVAAVVDFIFMQINSFNIKKTLLKLYSY
jgi:hypothetical protein